MRRTHVIGLFLAAAIVTAVLEVLLKDSAGASLLLTIAFWKAVSEGAVALAAVATLTRAKWIAPIRGRLASLYPVILLTSFLMGLLALKMDLYPWSDSPTWWMNKWAVLGRNIGLSLILFALAWRISAEPKGPSGRLTVVMLLVFVVAQTLFAFDVIMSLEYPWISTLFGGYFFIEALFAGMAVAGMVCFFLLRGGSGAAVADIRVTLRDVATLIFGFSLLWAGMFYSQFLVIWYGNIPEEAGFLVKRLSSSPIKEMSYAVLGALFFAPFLTLISKRAKSSPAAVFLASLFVICGIFAERVVFLAPVAGLHPGTLIPEFALILLLAVSLIAEVRSAPKG
jgi:hypothetical protein